MLLDMRHNEPAQVRVFEAMQSSRIPFYLTGSRFMGCERPDSDWDFLTTNTKEAQEFLHGAGFSTDILTTQKYVCERGAETVAVVQAVEGDVKVQVQLVRDADVQRMCRDIIHTFFPEHRNMGRADRMYVWNGLADVVRYAVPLEIWMGSA